MKRIAIVAALWPSLALAQQPPAPSGAAAFAGQVATALATVLEERDAARAQVTALSAELDKLRAANKAPENKP